MADLTAVFVYLKNNCGYADMPNKQIRRAILIFAQQNRWDLSNYAAYEPMIFARWAERPQRQVSHPLTVSEKMRIADD